MADAAALGEEIAELDETISTIEGDTKAATKVRDMEHSDFLTTQADYQSSVDALQGGIDTLKAKAHDIEGATFTQEAIKVLKSPIIPEKSRKFIKNYVEQDPEQRLADAFFERPRKEQMSLIQVERNPAKAYNFASDTILEMFEEMKSKFEGKVADTEKHETTDKHEYMMLKQDLDNQLATANGQRSTKAEMKAKAMQGVADAKGSLADVTGTRDADVEYLADTDAVCRTKSSDFDDRQKLRTEEIEALEQAKEVLGGTPTTEGEKHLPQLLQSSKALVQLRASVRNPSQLSVAAFLQEQGKKLNSRVLSVIALRVAADPFKSVKKLIKDMIVKLMEEANEEAEHKGFCDKELSTNEHTRKEKTEAVEILTAEIDQLNASLLQLQSEIQDLTKAVSELDAAAAEATKIRTAEKEKNQVTVSDAKAAQAAVATALKVLKDFYDKAEKATALVQTETTVAAKKEGQPEVFGDEAYTGMGGAAGGVLGMIEVIQSDFERLEAETLAEEEQSEKEYTEFMNDTELDKTSKTSDTDHKKSKQQNQDQALLEKKADLKGTQKELDTAMKYFEELKPQCISTGESYEDKVAARKEEIESLQEALKVLNGEDMAA